MSVFHFHTVEKEPVFLNIEKSSLLSEETHTDKSTMWRFKVHSSDGKERKESEEIELSFLKQLYKSDPVKFRKQWVNFNLSGDEAKDNLYRLLNSYILFHNKQKNIFFRDLRSTPYGEIEDREREYEYDMRWPYGKNYNIVLKCGGFWNKNFIEFEVNTDTVTNLKGTLNKFTLECENYVAIFDQKSIIKKLP